MITWKEGILPGSIGSSFFQIVKWSFVIMTTITELTTVAELVAAGLIESTQALEVLLKKPKTKPVGRKIDDSPEHQMLCDQILETIESGKSGIKWKTGRLNRVLFGLVSGTGDEEIERERKIRHAQIGKALKDLASKGLIDKPSVSNAAHTFYTKLEGPRGLPMKDQEDQKTQD
jgi:hypothetical protein